MKSCLYIVCAFLICTAAQAAAPTSESIEKLLVVTNSEKMVAAIQVQVDQAMKTGMAQAFKGQNMDADAQKTAEEMGKKLSADMRRDIKWESCKRPSLRSELSCGSRTKLPHTTMGAALSRVVTNAKKGPFAPFAILAF